MNKTSINTILYRKQIRSTPWLKNHKNAKERCRRTPSYIIKNIKYEMTIKEVKELWFRDKAYNMRTPVLHRINKFSNYTAFNCEFMEKVLHDSLSDLNVSKINLYYYEQF